MHVSGEIRAAKTADLGKLEAIVDATALFPSELLAGMIEGDAGNAGWLVFDNGDVPIALAYYAPERMTQGTWNLLLIAVDPAYQGQGVGRAIMSHVETHLAAEGQRVLLVETSGLPAFERTRRFYDLLGYAEEARIRDFYDAGDDKVVFWKAL